MRNQQLYELNRRRTVNVNNALKEKKKNTVF